jgi:hypothetical protein
VVRVAKLEEQAERVDAAVGATAEKFVNDHNALKARVEKLEKQHDDAEMLRHALAKSEIERLKAIRERESWKLLADRTNERLSAAEARVAELEQQIGQADAEDADTGYALRLFVDGRRVLSHELGPTQAGAFLIAADHLAKYLREEYKPITDAAKARVSKLEAASGGGGLKPHARGVVRDLIDAAYGVRDFAGPPLIRDEKRYRTEVDKLGVALAAAERLLTDPLPALPASGGGGEQEPVAWGFTYANGSTDGRFYNSRAAAEEAVPNNGTVVPLYRSPPQPRGWLTNEERESLWWFAQAEWPRSYGAADRHADIVRSLLDRSTPPKVRLVRHLNLFDHHGDRTDAFDAVEVFAALAAAGVEVKEVGGE